MANSKARKLIQESRSAVRELMQSGLADLIDSFVSDLMKNKSKAKIKKADDYEKEVIDAITVVADEAIKMAKKEVPKSKDVKLTDIVKDEIKFADFSNLPKSVQKLISERSKAIVGKQIKDLEVLMLGQLKKEPGGWVERR